MIHDVLILLLWWCLLAFGCAAVMWFLSERGRRQRAGLVPPADAPTPPIRYIPNASPHPRQHDVVWLEAPNDRSAWQILEGRR